MKKTYTSKLVRAGVTAALYVVLSFATMPIAGGAIQCRVAEALCLLPLFFGEAVPAVFCGCLITNFLIGSPLPDVVFGSLVTLICAIGTYFVGKLKIKTRVKVLLGGAFPVVLNALLLPLVWYMCYGKLEYVYILQALFLFIGQALSVYGIGGILVSVIEKTHKS